MDDSSVPPDLARFEASPPPMEAPDPHPSRATASGVQVTSLDDLVVKLRHCFRRDPRGCEAAALLSAYTGQHDDWLDYAVFDPSAYTRNLIDRTDDFELLLLCWDRDQPSPIHNHEGQNCWMGVLEGPIEEVRYQLVPEGPAAEGRSGIREDGPVLSYQPGQVAFIRDDIALHVVRATAAGRAASLHLYARPFDQCNVYCPDTGRVSRKQLVLTSIRGQRLEA